MCEIFFPIFSFFSKKTGSNLRFFTQIFSSVQILQFPRATMGRFSGVVMLLSAHSFYYYYVLVEPVPTAGTSLSQLKCRSIHPPYIRTQWNYRTAMTCITLSYESMNSLYNPIRPQYPLHPQCYTLGGKNFVAKKTIPKYFVRKISSIAHKTFRLRKISSYFCQILTILWSFWYEMFQFYCMKYESFKIRLLTEVELIRMYSILTFKI